MAQIKNIIAQAGADAEQKVIAAKRQHVDEVRAILRDLTRFKFTQRRGADSDRTAVAIDVRPGLPDVLKTVAEQQLETGERWGLELVGIWSHDIIKLQQDTASLLPLTGSLFAIPEWQERAQRYKASLKSAAELANELAEYAKQAEVLRKMIALNEDVLGVYRPIAELIPDRGRIELFWVVIGAMAKLLGVAVEGLTVAVLAHELAHAFIHVGLDSDSRRWEDGFWECKAPVQEALAQYYTHKTVSVLKDERNDPAPWQAYSALLEAQRRNGATNYTRHIEWVQKDRFSLEVIREAILGLRRHRIAPEFAALSEALPGIADGFAAAAGTQ